MGLEDHRRAAPSALRVAVITVSDTRDLDSDASGKEIERLLRGAGHQTAERVVVPDEPVLIALALRNALAASGLDAVVLNGGTGLARRDGTVEVASRFFERELPGFGELFRYLSFQEIGAAAILSRAAAGIARGRAIFCLPGSTKAVTLAMEKLILPEIGHIAGELRK
jgi:molybdenum cofactor biosynthesis protein B